MRRLPEELREVLRRPLGRLFQGVDQALQALGKPKLLASVGDAVTSELMRRGIRPDLAVVDHHIMREPISEEMKALLKWPTRTVKVRNPPGTLTEELMEALKLPKPLRIEVEGEEDLATLACGFLLPEGAVILYGQPGKGVVAVEVTAQKREEFLKLFEEFL
jgi:uncharacterized protein (UPF0218 family)